MAPDLTEQQTTIQEWANRGYPAADIARVMGIKPAQVFDQVSAIRKKGFAVRLLSSPEAKRLNQAEAERIAQSYAR